jgi:hypothetical protein
MTLQERLNEIYDTLGIRPYEPKPDTAEELRNNLTYSITQAIEKDILELMGEDEKYDDYGGIAINRDAYEPIIRNELKAELRLKLKEYIGG